MRSRRLNEPDGNNNSVAISDDDNKYRKMREAQRERESRRRGMLSYTAFLCLALGVPLMIIAYFTPFFVVEQLRCRAGDKLWADPVAQSMERGYAAYFDNPPLYLSEEYNKTMLWGTYEPSRIFAMKSRTARPVTVGIAWYDESRHNRLRHVTPFLHNKVRAPRTTYKANRDPEVMQMRWIVHDGIHYGKQTIKDAANQLSLEVEFLKSPTGDSWHVRIQGEKDKGKGPIDFVVYILNSDADAECTVIDPQQTHNDGDWSPVVESTLGAGGTPFQLTVNDRHNPLFDVAPWRIYGLHVDDAEDAFSLTAVDTVGGTPAERAETGGQGIARGFQAEDLQRQKMDLRDLPDSTYTIIDSVNPSSFNNAPQEKGHNMIVLKKRYDTHFRLEMSLIPLEKERRPRAEGSGALSSCQLSNLFRRREKTVYAHARKIVRPWVTGAFNVSGTLYEHGTAQTLGEAFGSMYYGTGRYLAVDAGLDKAWDQRGSAVQLWSDDQLHSSSHVASAFSAVGSRTDEAFGQSYLTGLQLLFLTRWNKEMVKDVLASWLVGAQDPQTGFIPSRTGFTADVRSTMPRALRYEHTTFGSPPTLLLGLQELLKEMEAKGGRIEKAKQTKYRNTGDYYSAETKADEAFLRLILPALRKWRAWWHSTQCGGLGADAAPTCGQRPLEAWPTTPTGDAADQLAYRWRSRDGATLSASGMEDYPRPTCTGEHALEAHVDLFSWIALLSKLISRIEVHHLREKESVAVDWEAHLNALHWDARAERYADRIGCESQAFSSYVGYVSLYPVLLGVVRKDLDRVRATLRLARSELWTDHGLMSVSFESVAQARAAGLAHRNLWMGMVWPSTNLLMLYSLRSTYRDELAGDALVADMYEQLRVRMAELLRSSGRWWEFYNPVTGDGEGSKTYIGQQALMLGILSDFSHE